MLAFSCSGARQLPNVATEDSVPEVSSRSANHTMILITVCQDLWMEVMHGTLAQVENHDFVSSVRLNPNDLSSSFPVP